MGSPWVWERYIQLTSTSACQRCQCCLWVWGGIPARPLGIPAAKAGRQAAKGRHQLTQSQGRAVGAALPQYNIPTTIRARWCPMVPATSSSKCCTSTWHPSARHSPGGTDSFASSAIGLVRGHKAARGHRSSCEKPSRACEHPVLPLQHQPQAITLQPPKAAAPLTGTAENRRVQLPQVTNQQISFNHRDLIFFFFLKLNGGICNFLTALILLEMEGIQLSTNCSSLVASEENNTATELPQLTKPLQLTAGQMKLRQDDAATHRSSPWKTRPMPDPGGSSVTWTSFSPPCCPELSQQQDPLLHCQHQPNDQVKRSEYLSLLKTWCSLELLGEFKSENQNPQSADDGKAW